MSVIYIVKGDVKACIWL